jgi:signal transduction histidine kinase/CheY-like chemotaxis protein
MMSLLSTIQLSDVSESSPRKKVETAESCGYDVLNALSSHIAVIDREGIIVTVNTAWMKFARENSSDTSTLGIGCNYLQACREALRPENSENGLDALQGLLRVMKGQLDEFEMTYPCHSPLQNRWFLMRCTPISSHPGYVLICHSNISETMKATQELRERERELQAFHIIHRQVASQISLEPVVKTILEQILEIMKPDLALFFLRDGKNLILKEVVPAQGGSVIRDSDHHEVGKCLCGLAAESGKSVYSYDMKNDSRCSMKECKQAGYRSFASVPLVANGIVLGCIGIASREPRDFQVSGAFLDAAAQDVTLSLKNALLYEQVKEYAEDVQKQLYERERLEETLVQNQKLEAIGHLAGGIAHDFNNILAAIMGYSELALLKSSEPETREYLEGVVKASHRAKDLIQQILTFSRKGESNLMPLDLCSLLKDTLPLIKATLPSTIIIQDDIQGLRSAPILGNPTQLQRLFMNLCSNASQAMENDGGALIIKLKKIQVGDDLLFRCPELKPEVAYVELSVRDTGMGIASEHIHSIFEPYFSTKVPGKGTGLGLAVVHGIVKSHNGGIVVNSFLGHGTTISIYLPQIDTTQTIEQILFKPQAGAGSEHILVVDDEDAIVDIFKSTLQNKGYTTTSCRNSREAMTLFRNSPESFDLVLCDLTMPDLTGDVLAKRIREIRKDIPIIICTGHAAESLIGRNFEPADLILQKPLSQRELIGAVRELLDRDRSR